MYTKTYDLRKRSNCKRKSLLEPELKKKEIDEKTKTKRKQRPTKI